MRKKFNLFPKFQFSEEGGGGHCITCNFSLGLFLNFVSKIIDDDKKKVRIKNKTKYFRGGMKCVRK